MPSRKTTKAAASALLAEIPKKLLDQFVKGQMGAEAVQAASMACNKAMSKRALGSRFLPPPGLPTGRVATGRQQQPPQRSERQDRSEREWVGTD